MERKEARKARTTQRKQARKIKNNVAFQGNQHWQGLISNGTVEVAA